MQINADDFSRIREFYELSQLDFANICGVSQPYVNMIERNKRPLTAKVKMRLLETLELNEEKLTAMTEACRLYEETRNRLRD